MYQPWWKKLLRGLLLVVLSPLIVLYAIADRHGETIEIWSLKVMDTGVEFGSSVRNFWRIFVGLVRIAGWITIVLLVAASVLTLVYLVLRENGVPWSALDAYYPIAVRILENKVAWAAISIVLGAMVAMSHLLNLEINQNKFRQEQEDRWRKEYEEKLAKERERRGDLWPGA
jgi:hypothetical protein